MRDQKEIEKTERAMSCVARYPAQGSRESFWECVRCHIRKKGGKKAEERRGETSERKGTKAEKGKAKASVITNEGKSKGGQDTCYKEFLGKCEAVKKVYEACTCTQCTKEDGVTRAHV